MSGSHNTFVCFTILLCFLSCVSSYKFLGILPTGARSHHIVGSALFKELARKGHEVTVISPFPLKEPMKNYVDVSIPTVMKAVENVIINLFDQLKLSTIEKITKIFGLGLIITEAALTDPNVKEFLKTNQTFDAIICEVFLSEALYGFSEHFNAPLIGFGTFGAIEWNTEMVGTPSPPSYVPSPLLHFTDHMTLPQRIGNLAHITFSKIFHEYIYMPKQVALYKKYFPNAESSLHDVRKNAALVLINSHVSLSFARPYVPNQIEVGGLHINRKRKPLPEDIKKFIEESPHGVIYFSMGSNLKSKILPIEKRQEILKTFAGLKQRVLWKFEDAELEGKPDNVFISDWFPQDDILAHDNVIAFITHGGLLSTTESIYHGKPFIGIPIFGDQFLNMARAVENGYGIMLDYNTLSSVTFKEAIQRITTDSSYTKLVRDMSSRYRDQPMLPIDLATYWVEHVARHKGAKYLHCAGQDLSFIEYHNIDAMIILFGGILFVFALLVWLVVFIYKFLIRVFVGKSNKKLKKH